MIGKIAAVTLWILIAYFDIWSKIQPDNHIFLTIALWAMFFLGDEALVSYKRIIEKRVHNPEDNKE